MEWWISEVLELTKTSASYAFQVISYADIKKPHNIWRQRAINCITPSLQYSITP
jgi:hypothetical protein